MIHLESAIDGRMYLSGDSRWDGPQIDGYSCSLDFFCGSLYSCTLYSWFHMWSFGMQSDVERIAFEDMLLLFA